jgi:parallel beta-helix repeat protein
MVWILYGYDPTTVAQDAAGNVDATAAATVHTAYAGSSPYTATKSVNPVTGLEDADTAGVVTADSLGRLGFFAQDYTSTLYLRQGSNSWPINPTNHAQATGIITAGKVDKGALVFNVKDYGAVGNGSTNDTVAVQAAIDAANAANGGQVFFPAGTYNVQTALTLYTRVALQGVRDKSKVLFAGTQTSGIVANSRTAPSIKDLILDCNASATLTYAVYIGAGSGAVVDGVTVTNQTLASSTGIVFDTAATDGRVVRSAFTSVRRGVSIIAGSKRIDVERNRFDTCAEYGFYGVSSAVSQLEDITVSGNHFSGIIGGTPRQPLYFTAGTTGYWARRVKILGNTIIGNYTSYTDGTGNGDALAAYNLEDSVVANNTVLGGGDAGISVWRSKRVTIVGNVCGHNNINGVLLDDSDNCTITGNVCYNNRRNFDGTLSVGARGGIRLMTGSTSNIVTGNRCFDDQGVKTQDYGVVVVGGGDPAVTNVVSGNHLTDNLTGDLSDAGTGTVTAATATVVNSVATASTAQTLVVGTNLLTLTSATCVLTLPGHTAGAVVNVSLKQNATGTRAVTWPTIKWPFGITPTLAILAGSVDTFSIESDGTDWRGVQTATYA